MKNDPIKFDKKKLILSAKNVEFEVPIADVLAFDEIVVVLLEQSVDENVYGLNRDGKIIWRIQKEKFPHGVNSYVNMWREGENLGLGNFTGYTITADPRTGKILKKEFTK